MPEIDGVNAELLTLLQDDGRMTNAKLAERIGMSETSCWRRLKRREESGIIETTPNILACHNTTGADDFLLIVVAKDLDDYSVFVDSTLRRLPGVTSIRSKSLRR